MLRAATLAIVLTVSTFVSAQNVDITRHDPLGIGVAFPVPATQEEVELGRDLFFDPILSQNGTISCATCHDPAHGWSDGRRVAVGIRNQLGTRNSPTIINSAHSPLMFWDGRVVGHASQSLLPLVNPIEMGQQSEADVLLKISAVDSYVERFTRLYGVDRTRNPPTPITAERLARLFACFESTILSYNAPIDRRLAGDVTALSESAEIGFQLFKKANCMACHIPPLFTDNVMHNNGSEIAGRRAGALPDNDRSHDQGLAVVTRNINDRRKFKTPTLREIKHTAPYMHHGLYPTLDSVIVHYALGGADQHGRVDRRIDPAIKPLNYTPTQLKYMKIFLLEAFSSVNNTAQLVK